MIQHGLPDKFFERDDETPDDGFYEQPRFTTHIDDATINALTTFYGEVLSPSMRVLDLDLTPAKPDPIPAYCSHWHE